MKTLIKDAYVLLPDGTTPRTNILIAGDKIQAIGDVPEDFRPAKVIDGRNHLAVPGFVNAHTHASMTLLRSYADDMNLMDWLNNKVWPVEAKMNEDDIYWGAMLAAVEMIEGGTTSFADMYGPYMDKVAEVVADSGLRGVLSRGIIGVAPDGEQKLEENVALYKDFHGAADGRITVMFGPHAPYTCPPAFLKKVAAAAQSLGAEIHIHMHETQAEIEGSLKEYGKRPFAWVEETGLFDGKGTLAAHCVHLDDNDIEIIKKHHIRVAHNPGSNMKLASGTAPVPRLLKEGVCVALGTDGASSNNNLDMLEEVNLAAMLHKVHTLDPLAVPARTAVKMGTEYGAEAIGLQDTGKLEAGCKADITLFSMESAVWYPRHDLVSLLTYAAHADSVDTVLVDGKVLMENRELTTLDKERIFFEAQRCAERLTR
ncbi:MAG: amidohydrolase [Selenomonadaceae bacterium]|nr:amidohydrolase [Selenomonadaceae bacterium]